MRIGQLDKRITIQRRSQTLDAYGQQVDSWSTVADCWADVRPVGGREKLSAMAMQADLTHTVAVRYNVALLPPKEAAANRIVYATPAGSRVLNITSARDVDEGRRWIVFDCVEGAQDGQ